MIFLLGENYALIGMKSGDIYEIHLNINLEEKTVINKNDSILKLSCRDNEVI